MALDEIKRLYLADPSDPSSQPSEGFAASSSPKVRVSFHISFGLQRINQVEHSSRDPFSHFLVCAHCVCVVVVVVDLFFKTKPVPNTLEFADETLVRRVSPTAAAMSPDAYDALGQKHCTFPWPDRQRCSLPPVRGAPPWSATQSSSSPSSSAASSLSAAAAAAYPSSSSTATSSVPLLSPASSSTAAASAAAAVTKEQTENTPVTPVQSEDPSQTATSLAPTNSQAPNGDVAATSETLVTPLQSVGDAVPEPTSTDAAPHVSGGAEGQGQEQPVAVERASASVPLPLRFPHLLLRTPLKKKDSSGAGDPDCSVDSTSVLPKDDDVYTAPISTNTASSNTSSGDGGGDGAGAIVGGFVATEGKKPKLAPVPREVRLKKSY